MNKGSIVERLCSDLDRKEPRYKSPTLLYLLQLQSSSGNICSCCWANHGWECHKTDFEKYDNTFSSETLALHKSLTHLLP